MPGASVSACGGDPGLQPSTGRTNCRTRSSFSRLRAPQAWRLDDARNLSGLGKAGQKPPQKEAWPEGCSYEKAHNSRRCILYIVRRTQLYLDDAIWNALHARARSRKTTVSELVREAVRERYLGGREERMKAMQEFVGIRRGRSVPLDAVEYIRNLRQGDRLDRLHKK